MSYFEKNGIVTLTMTRADYQMLLMALGYATGTAWLNDSPIKDWVGLVNRLNEGNPNFVPYAT